MQGLRTSKDKERASHLQQGEVMKTSWNNLPKVELMMVLERIRNTPRTSAGANKIRAAIKQAENAIEAAEQMKRALREMQLLVNDFMPNIGRCSLQNYARMNDAPIAARAAIVNYLAAVPEREHVETEDTATV